VKCIVRSVCGELMVKKEEERGCLENERSAISSSGSGDLMDEID